ncbi:N-6 DNA methylase, partial [Alistipes shahii]|uniref:N-6 DNA methylase n=1 Tax=Alistipes shahii TaxID=328814 RepID=UPI003AABFCED
MRELHELLRHYAGSEQRYKDLVQSMRNSTLTAFYTPPAIVRALAETLRDAGVVPRRLLDPSAGAGIFPSSFRETADGEVEILSFEKDLLTGQVLSALAREREQVVIDGFQTIESAYDSYFDVVTSNIPFGDTRIFDASFRKSDDPVRGQALKAVHNYFFIKGLDTLREGGILAFVTSAGVMDAPGNEPVRRYLMEHARLVSAVRLPNNLFTEYAGTEVASDLVVLQKQSEKRKLTPDEQRFVNSSEIGNGIYLNDYHRDFKHAIHTTFSHEKGLYGQSSLVLHYDGGPERIAERLRGILAHDFATRLDTERYTQYLRPLHIPQAQTVPPIARRQNRVAAPQSVPPPEPASVAPTPEVSAPAASLFGSAAAVPIARRPLGQRRRAGRNTDTTGMSDLFTQGNLFAQPAEAAEAADAPAAIAAPASENKDPRPFTGTMLPHYKEWSLVLFEGQVGRLVGLTRQGCTFHPEELGTLSRYRAERYIPLRDTYQLLYRLEMQNEIEYKGLRRKLNGCYENFTALLGDLNKKENAAFVLNDPGGREVLGLERFVEGRKQLSDILRRPVSFDPNEIKHVDTAAEALAASLNKFGRVEFPYMESLASRSRQELTDELGARIFYNPMVKGYEIRERLAAGNVVAKAEWIEDYLKENPDDDASRRSLALLREAAPKRIEFEELDFNLGERWIPTDIYEGFCEHFFQVPVSVSYSAKMDAFGIENHGYSPLISQKYVVKGDFEVYDGMDLLHHAMLNTLPNINKDGGKDEHGKTIRIPDFEARQKADTLITEIRQAFVEWLHAQPDDFKERLTDLYNRKFNCYVRPRYDGSHQQFPGLDLRGLGIDDLYPSQKDAIWMIKQNGGGICDHEVGTGKTLIMCVAAYEMHRLGLARKPMIIGIKANIHEIARTFRTAYPNARLLYPGKEDFTPENRLRIFSDIKNNNWDCIILTHEQFGKIPQSAEVQQQILRQEMDDIDENLASYEKQGGHVDGWILRGLEKRKENLDAKLHELQETIDAQKDDTVDFQQMGIDHLFVDESHNFKNLMFNTRHSRVSGLGNTDGSKKAMNLLYAIRTIQQRTGRDLGATFLSGTTIANSLTELYLLFKYLRPKELERQDIPCFDAWAAVFAQKTSEFEFSVTNEVISKERFRYFIKVPELAMFYNEITDYRTAADVGIDRPELDEELCQIPMTDDQQAFLDKLVLFAKTGDPEHIGRADLSDGEVKALMLLVTMYSNKLSLDMRLISPAYADSPGNKASRSAANIAEYYRRYEDQKGTQMVFCDLSTYKPGIWNVYSEIKRKLVEDHGIPAQEIRFVQEAASDKVRQAMFDAMNEGKIRVLFGSTQKLGTGVNAQKRIVCMHHLDIPWRPMDLEQRNGRGARKGNIVAKEYAGNKVKAYVYAVLRTLDAYKLNLLHNKQQFIDQLKRNRLGARRLDEGAISEDSGMNFAEWMAVVSGNTDLLQKAKLEGRIAALESEQTIFMRTRHEAQSQLQRYTAEIGRRDAMLERLKRDWDYINEVAPPDAKGKRANPLRIDGVESADIVAHGKRLVEIDRTVNTGDDYQKIGTLFDFRILVRTERMQKDGLALTVNKFMVEGLDGIKYTFNNGHLAAEPKTAATNFIRALDTIPSLMATYEKEKKQFTRDIPTFEQQIAAVWPKEEELKRLKAEAESLTRKIQLDIAQKQQEMQAKTADNGNGLKIENAEVVDEVVKPSKAEPLSTASESQEEPPEEREHVVSPPESDFIRNHILLVRPATNMKAKG